MNKDQQYNIWQRFKNFIERLYSRYNTSIVYNFILLTIFGVIVFLAFSSNLEDNATLIVLLITAIISFMLMLEQHRVAEAQEKSNTEQRYSNAINQIESKREGVVRIGFKNLHQLALEYKSKYKRERICDVFCDYLKAESGVLNNGISPATVQFILNLLINKNDSTEIFFPSKWLDLSEVNFKGADLNNTNLQGAQLQGANLWNTELQGANLEKAQFQGADLREAQFQGADLREAQFQGADLREAQLQGADLREAQLQGADLREAQLQGADLIESNLQEANLKGVKLDNVKLQGANFTGAKNLTVTQLQRAKDSNLERVHLSGIDLNNGDFSNFNLSNAQLQGVNLERVQFEGANLSAAHFQGANLWNTKLQGANLSEAQLQGAYLGETQLQGTCLWEVWLQGADLREAQLQGAKFNKTNFSGAYTDDPFIFPSTNLKRAVARLEKRASQSTDLQNVVFSGGVKPDDLSNFRRKRTAMENVLTDIKYHNIDGFKEKMDEVENILKQNMGKPENNSIPSQGVITGIYPKADADKVIEDLKRIINDLAALKKSN